MRPIVTALAWSLRVFFCLFVSHKREPDKTAEPIDVPFRVWTPVNPRNHMLDEVGIPLGETATFLGAF